MRLKKGLQVSYHCTKVFFNTLVFQLLTVALVIALAVLLFGNFVNVIIDLVKNLKVDEFLIEIIEHVNKEDFSGSVLGDSIQSFVDNAKEYLSQLPKFFDYVSWMYLLAFVLIFVYRILYSATDVSVGYSVSEFMSTNNIRSFLWYAVKKIKENMTFTLLQALITIPLDMAVLFTSVGFFVVLWIPLGKICIVPSLLILLLLYSLRMSLFAFWLPSVAVDNLSVKKALQNNFKTLGGKLGGVFVHTLLFVAVMVGANFAVNYFFHNAWALVCSVAFSITLFFILKCVYFIDYYEATDKRYFVVKLKMFGLDRVEKKYQKNLEK